MMHLIRKPSWRGGNFASSNYMDFLKDDHFINIFEKSLIDTPEVLRKNFESI